MSSEVTVVEIYDCYHCDRCNFCIGELIVFSDGSEEITCDGHTSCFGTLCGRKSYKT